MHREDNESKSALLKEYFLNVYLIALLLELNEEVRELHHLEFEETELELDKVA